MSGRHRGAEQGNLVVPETTAVGHRRRPGCSYAQAFTVTVVLLLGGCATTHPLMPTPVLYVGPHARPLLSGIVTDQQPAQLDLLYVTDRAPSANGDASEPYTAERSRSTAFGSTIVEFGNEATLNGLIETTLRGGSMDLKLGATRELGRFPPIPYEIAVGPDGITRLPSVVDAHEKARRALQAEIMRRLASVPRKEVVLFIHGYHNNFEDAALTMGELCHFLGREFVCGIFTWPAGGRRGILFGYNVDRESGEYAVEDLLKTIRIIAETTGVQKIHLIAHSRGNAILGVALAELGAEAYMLGGSLGAHFRIGNVVLAAPDIDADVALSLIFKVFSDPELPFRGEANPHVKVEVSPGFKVTAYVSPDDKALATSSWLSGSFVRLGRIDARMLTPHQIDEIRMLGTADVVQVRGTTDFFGHDYFVSNPEVSADMIAMLRYGLKPNEPGRPLEEIVDPFWRVIPITDAGANR